MLSLALAFVLAAPPDKVHDPEYVARPGDRALVACWVSRPGGGYAYKPAPGFASAAAYAAHSKATRSGDSRAAGQLRARGELVELAPWSPVTVDALEEYARGADQADAAIVVVSAGPAAGRKLWVALSDVVRPTDAPEDRAGAEIAAKAAAEKARRAARAATMLKSAGNLERAGKVPGAVEHYRRIAKDFPGTAAAATAAARLKALGSR